MSEVGNMVNHARMALIALVVLTLLVAAVWLTKW